MLQIFEIESENGPYELHYDEEWLAITKKFNPIFPRTRMRVNFRLAYGFPRNKKSFCIFFFGFYW